MRLEEKILLNKIDLGKTGELIDKTVFINRVAKVVKGGRRFNFSALVVTGDKAGHVGFGMGKAAEVPEAIKKAGEAARRNLFRVQMRGGTIAHDVLGKSGATTVMLKPGKPGSGIIAGGAVRAIVELAGIHDIKTKIIGSSTAINVIRATVDGLLRLRSPEFISKNRRLSLEEMGYVPY